MSSILTCQDVSINFGGVKAVQNVSLEIQKGSVTSIIGPNGAGKTTFFNIISGVYKPTSGKVLFDGDDITNLSQHEVSRLGMARTFQNIRLFSQLDNVRNVQSALDARANYTMLEAILGLPRKRVEDRRNFEIAMECLDLVGLKEFAYDRPGSLPYGMQRKVELARALSSNPKLLLLDEPAAGLNPVEVEDFIQLLRRIKDQRDLTILLIEHRLKVVTTLSDEVFVLNFGELLTHGTPEEVQSNPKVIEAYMGEDEEEEE
ncbi:MAG: ABC transporter ATP-binding protein [Eubacteriales bacterium]|nr:ABC transporter ATP-binding protein [Clostridiales bacterium]MDO5544353.1 ABC transporter ATP-binding protein [Eubacteriales bacterium]